MSKEFEIYIRYAKEVDDFFKNLQNVLSSIKKDVEKITPRAKVYLFGSVAKGRYTYASDVDVLKARIKSICRGCPIELHIVDRQTFEKWYRRFIKPEELIEIT